MTNDRIGMICNFFKEKNCFLIFRVYPDFYSRDTMMWQKYDFVPDSYSRNMMTWHKYGFALDSYSRDMMTWHNVSICISIPVLYLLTYKCTLFQIGPRLFGFLNVPLV